tara:strand:+ start:1403 stop:1699 length:297 start_codon:yes stop_codon:yes gene_type:complete
MMAKKKRLVPRASFPEETKMAGESHRQVLVEDIEGGDYCTYYERGWRLGRVKKNHKGYKYKWISLFPKMWKQFLLEKSKKIKHEKVLCGWRKIEAEGN